MTMGIDKFTLSHKFNHHNEIFYFHERMFFNFRTSSKGVLLMTQLKFSGLFDEDMTVAKLDFSVNLT